MMKVYVASSWRNEVQQHVVRALRAVGYEVYDYRNPHHPARAGGGFAWADIDPKWQAWTAQQQIDAYDHELAQRGLALDLTALGRADACVMVQPCGRSAALELGYAVGAGKPTAVLMADGQEPELMLRMADKLTTSIEGVLVWLAVVSGKRAAEAELAKASARARVKPANLPVWAAMTISEKIAQVLREGRGPLALDDADYHDRRAEVFDLIADADESVWRMALDRVELGRKIAETRAMAERARQRAIDLRQNERFAELAAQ